MRITVKDWSKKVDHMVVRDRKIVIAHQFDHFHQNSLANLYD